MKVKLSKEKTVTSALLLLIFIISFYLRGVLVGSKLSYPRLLAIDPYVFFRTGGYIIEGKWELWENDIFIGYGTLPEGANHWHDFYLVHFSYVALFYIVKLFFPSVTWYNVAVYGPAFFGALLSVLVYLLTLEMFRNRRAALISAFFLAIMPAIMYRTSAGFIEKEPIAGIFMLLSLYFLAKSHNHSPSSVSIKSVIKERGEIVKVAKPTIFSLFSAFFITLMAGTWGGVRLPIIVIATWIFLWLLFNKHAERFLFSYIPFVFFTFIFFSLKIFPTVLPVTGESMLLNYGATVVVLLRFAVERLNLIERRNLKFFIPSIYILFLFSVAVASYMFPDFGSWVNYQFMKVQNPITLGVIPSTVAESQGASGFFNSAPEQFGTGYAVLAFRLDRNLRIFSAIYLAYLAIALFAYEFFFRRRVNIYYIFLISWFVWGVLSAMGAVRLSYFLSFPVAMLAGLSLWRLSSFAFLKIKAHVRGEEARRYIRMGVAVIFSLVLMLHFLSGYTMASSINSSLSNDWYEAFKWIRENTNKSDTVLEWWDFGYWFQEVAERRTIVDGGYHGRNPLQRVAKFYTEPLSNESLKFLREFSVDYVMVSPDLIGKFGAMSKIANWGAKVDTLPVFRLVEEKQRGNKHLFKYSFAGQDIIVAFSLFSKENVTAVANVTALMKTPFAQAYIRDVSFGGKVFRNENANAIPGMVYFAGNAVIFIPEAVEDCVFVRLYFFDGKDINAPGFVRGYEKYFEPVYDKLGMKIYRVRYENFPEEIMKMGEREEIKSSDELFEKYKDIIYG